MMTALRVSWLAFVLLLLCGAGVAATDLACRPLQINEVPWSGPDEYGQGLLWQVTRQGAPSGYVFGTIHIAERHVSAQLDQVRDILTGSEILVMESIFEQDGIEALRKMMFFTDGTNLQDIIADALYAQTLAILRAYHITETELAAMKPWAAYLTMSYPADMGAILDQRLLQLALAAGVETRGLESMVEQGDLFNSLSLDDQVRLLTDAVCHREILEGDFAKMISLYAAGDLAGLSAYGQRYSFGDNTLYETLTARLLTRRNRLMVERMQTALETGNAFIAVGALHLPGAEGILALLERRGFELTRIF